MRLQSKEEQRAAIQLLRMIGSSNIKVLIDQKKNLFEYSKNFAEFEKPDFILLKEALLAYEKIILHQKAEAEREKKSKGDNIDEADKRYLFKLFHVILNSFGTDDLEWFCATETILNALFNIKSNNAPEYAS